MLEFMVPVPRFDVGINNGPSIPISGVCSVEISICGIGEDAGGCGPEI
jgi:hypothetical protein